MIFRNGTNLFKCLNPKFSEETPEPAVGELSCPQCWTLNADRTSCVLSDTTCFELSCDSATLSFAFFPKMFGQSDLSHNFGVTGLEANSALGQFKYSKGLGTNGQDRAQHNQSLKSKHLTLYFTLIFIN